MITGVPPHVHQVILDACSKADVIPVTIQVRGNRPQQKLEVFVDNRSGVSHEHCRLVAGGIDAALAGDTWYDKLVSVDISSPGAEMPLTELWQAEKHIGRHIACKLKDGSQIEGKLEIADPDAITVRVQQKEKQKKMEETAHVITAAEIAEIRVLIKV